MRCPTWTLLASVLASVSIPAQPPPRPNTAEAQCEEYPKEDLEPDLSNPGADGFHSLFTGVDFTGWWLNCRTSLSPSPTTRGPNIRVDPELKALYTSLRGSDGGVLMTKAKFMDYEIVFDYWSGFGGDNSLLHRADTSGRAYGTTLGYFNGYSLGGVWWEGGLFYRDLRPFVFAGTASDIRIPGISGGPNWTHLTRDLKAAGEAVPCPDSGCTQEDWRRLWDIDNWNQIRVTFRGGKSIDDSVRMRSWFRKLGAEHWVPLLVDSTLVREIKPGYIGLKLNSGGHFGTSYGTWYRDIRWRPWTSSTSAVAHGVSTPARHRPSIKVDAARHAVRIAFAQAEPTRRLRILSINGKTIAELQGVREEAQLSTTGWKRGVYLVDASAGGLHSWARLILP